MKTDATPGTDQPTALAGRVHELKTYEGRGELSIRFFKKMLDRLAVGFFRYEQVFERPIPEPTSRPYDRNGYDLLASAVWRIEIAMDTGDPEHLVDAANFLVLGWMRMAEDDDSPMHSGENSPGCITLDGKHKGARGIWAHLNGLPYEGAVGSVGRTPEQAAAEKLLLSVDNAGEEFMNFVRGRYGG